MQALDDAIRDAEAWLFRRAAKSDSDRRRYRLGAAFESQNGLDLDDVFLAGMDQLGGLGVLLMAAAAARLPADAYLSDILKAMSRTDAGRAARAWGVWAKWQWLRSLYEQAVDGFENSHAGRDPNAAWRKRRPTRRQQYLVMEICRLLLIAVPLFASSGDAHDWLKARGGNPRFKSPPPLPPIPSREELGL